MQWLLFEGKWDLEAEARFPHDLTKEERKQELVCWICGLKNILHVDDRTFSTKRTQKALWYIHVKPVSGVALTKIIIFQCSNIDINYSQESCHILHTLDLSTAATAGLSEAPDALWGDHQHPERKPITRGNTSEVVKCRWYAVHTKRPLKGCRIGADGPQSSNGQRGWRAHFAWKT